MAKRRIARKRRTRRVKAKRGPNILLRKSRCFARQAKPNLFVQHFEQEITNLVRGYLTGVKIPFRPVLSTHVLVMKCILSVKHSTGFSKHLAAFGIASCFV